MIEERASPSSDHRRHGTKIFENPARNDCLQVVGAEYSLDTGHVDFFDGVPESA